MAVTLSKGESRLGECEKPEQANTRMALPWPGSSAAAAFFSAANSARPSTPWRRNPSSTRCLELSLCSRYLSSLADTCLQEKGPWRTSVPVLPRNFR